MRTKSNAFVLQTCLTVQDNSVFLATCHDIGTPIPKNVKVVTKMLILIQIEKLASTVRSIDLCGMETSVFNALQDRIITVDQENVNFAHRDLLMIKFKENALALSKHLFCTKILLVLIANRHIFGTSKLDLAMPALWHTSMMFLLENVRALSTHPMKETKFVLPAINHFSGTIRPSNVKSAQQPSFTINKSTSAFAHWIDLMNIIVDA